MTSSGSERCSQGQLCIMACASAMLARAPGSASRHISHSARVFANKGIAVGQSSGMEALLCAASMMRSLFRFNSGTRPVMIIYTNLPKENTSELGAFAACSPLMTSGAIHLTVPPSWRTFRVSTRLSPKSSSFARRRIPLRWTRTLAALMSPWMMVGSWLCRYFRAQQISSTIIQRSTTAEAVLQMPRMALLRSTPRTYSRTRTISHDSGSTQAP
mmetsp:Transcript_48056/g.155059  ORF Transcript_48056/g.155059 Transcript_48056/m.155059 type:complete len:215 (-) Transcript_48056:1272-1916(-)